MDINRLIDILFRWWWLILIATLVAGISSAVTVYRQPPVYETRTTLAVGQTLTSPNPAAGEYYFSQQLAAFYADLVNREPIQLATMEALGISFLPSYTARVVPNTQLLEIWVHDTIPERAQIVANELANQLMLTSPTSKQESNLSRQQFIDKQLGYLQTQIEDTQSALDELLKKMPEINSASQIAETEDQIDALQIRLNNLQSNYANLLTNTSQGAVNTLTIIEPAQLPSTPMGTGRITTIVITASVGFMLAAGAIFLIEYIDDTYKTIDDVNRSLQIPVIGYIPKNNSEDFSTYVAQQPLSPIADAFRTLRTNLEYTSVDQSIRTIMISSSEDSDGKSTIALNLAFAITQADKKVALIDGDLRSPSIHKMLDLPRQPGLSEVFRDRLNIFDVVRYWKDNKSLIIIPAGNPPPNSAELLGSKKMDQIISVLEEVVDIVIVDSPPSFIADPLILSTKVDGVLLVVTAGKTRSRSAQLTKEQFQRVGAKIIGIVINQLKPGSGLYYPKYYQSDYVLENKPSKKSLRERLFPSKKPMDNTAQPVNPK